MPIQVKPSKKNPKLKATTLWRLKLSKIVKIMTNNADHSSTVINKAFFSENSRIPKRKFKA
ncbi:hypothetical protein [Bathymodiolus thermophilus thioautotrophic gill symbiont]|uniref:hypothetical protein n=1 Tax=Bathymodiolus thermophilus thioautotrophic gill symbiont TaxID=2360 RepID=UPI0013E04AC0|nr:hypothetical protein [Bathymodiolus thermophilus thioautotrophic gill symbiont]